MEVNLSTAQNPIMQDVHLNPSPLPGQKPSYIKSISIYIYI